MAQRKFYYKLKEAELIKQTFSSWIDKAAHIGNGKISILKSIIIKPKRTIFVQDPGSAAYCIEFQFINSEAIDVSHFFVSNGIKNEIGNTSPLHIAFKNKK